MVDGAAKLESAIDRDKWRRLVASAKGLNSQYSKKKKILFTPLSRTYSFTRAETIASGRPRVLSKDVISGVYDAYTLIVNPVSVLAVRVWRAPGAKTIRIKHERINYNTRIQKKGKKPLRTKGTCARARELADNTRALKIM